MENLFVELAKQIPSLVVLSLIVVFFLKQMREADKSFQEALAAILKHCEDEFSNIRKS